MVVGMVVGMVVVGFYGSSYSVWQMIGQRFGGWADRWDGRTMIDRVVDG